MKAVISTVSQASVDVRDECGEVRRVGEVSGPALLALIGSGKDDDADAWETMVRKIAELRLFPASGESWGGQRDLSVEEVGGSVLVVSQFTLMGKTKRGRRPSWSEAMPGPAAEPVVENIVRGLRDRGIHVETGEFGADMQVNSVNEGPYTVLVEC